MQRYIFPRTPPSIYPILTRRGLLHIAVLVDQRQHILVLVSSIFKDGFCKRAFYLVSAFLMHFQRCLVRHKDMGLNAVDVALVEHIVNGELQGLTGIALPPIVLVSYQYMGCTGAVHLVDVCHIDIANVFVVFGKTDCKFHVLGAKDGHLSHFSILTPWSLPKCLAFSVTISIS